MGRPLVEPYDIVGMKFNRLTVLKELEEWLPAGPKKPPHAKGARLYLCVCDCQLLLPEDQRSYIKSTKYRLVNGITKSCGCLKVESSFKNGQAKKLFCKYDLESEEYGIGYANHGEKFIFDKEDYEAINWYRWFVNTDGYLEAHSHKEYLNNNKKRNVHVKIHRVIFEKAYGRKPKEIDHVNGNPLDNRRCNLREATRHQNCWNRKRRRDNSSGTTGVIKTANNKWRASIMANGVNHHLGTFERKEDAIRVRKEAEEKYFGEYARRDK